MGVETEIIFLGCGTSTGVPVISCTCEVCTSDDPKNNRTRSSIFLKSENTSLLIDTGPDLRFQLLREGLTHADAVLYTHGHVDHTAGMDEIRAFCWRREDRFPIYGNADTIEILGGMFPWAFDRNYNGRGYVRADAIEFPERFEVGDFTITPFEVVHGAVQTHGFHILLPSGKVLIYASDIKALPPEADELVKEGDVHVFDGLRFEEHPSHMTVQEALALSERVHSKQTYLTHMSHEIDYSRISATLPDHCALAYDGLRLSL